MASLHIPLLSLGLSVKENGILRPVAMEMDREELNMLLGSLDAANKVEITLHAEKKGCLNYQTQLFQAVHLIKKHCISSQDFCYGFKNFYIQVCSCTW